MLVANALHRLDFHVSLRSAAVPRLRASLTGIQQSSIGVKLFSSFMARSERSGHEADGPREFRLGFVQNLEPGDLSIKIEIPQVDDRTSTLVSHLTGSNGMMVHTRLL